MTKDLNKGITKIEYNSLNLPKLMDIKSPLAEARKKYTYTASGAKLRVVSKWNPNFSTNPVIGSDVVPTTLTKTKTTDYVGNIVYEDNALKRILVDGGYIEGGVYNFYLTDHLGNNRAVAKADASIIQRTQFYPFGAAFADGLSAGLQPYKYNGKELDAEHGVNWYDYSARQKSDFGFTCVDPLAEKKPWLSPYAYCRNNPLRFIDPDGMDEWEINDKGEIKRIENKNHDAFYILDKEGNRQENKSKVFEYKTIQYTEIENGKGLNSYHIFEFAGDNIGTELFEFMANNTGVTKEYGGTAESPIEWSLNRFGEEGATGINVLSTGSERSKEPSGVDVIQGKHNKGIPLRESSHSHPYSSAADALFEPSGLPGTPKWDGKRGDIYNAIGVMDRNANISKTSPLFNVYSGYMKSYIHYNSSGIIKK